MIDPSCVEAHARAHPHAFAWAGDLGGMAGGLLVWAQGVAQGMTLVQVVGIVVALGSFGCAISRELRGWKYGSPK